VINETTSLKLGWEFWQFSETEIPSDIFLSR